MVENIDISIVAKQLSDEFDALIDEREAIREQVDKLEARAEEVDRKLQGIQQTLQGFSLYANAQEAPTALTKKTTVNLAEMLGRIRESMIAVEIPGPDVAKTLSECCRDILRQKGDWMSAIQVRDSLMASGFNFSNYTSNPLSSIHTTLRRLAQEELETESRDGSQVYRWKAKK